MEVMEVMEVMEATTMEEKMEEVTVQLLHLQTVIKTLIFLICLTDRNILEDSYQLVKHFPDFPQNYFF